MDTKTNNDEKYCHQCGNKFFVEDNGTSHHRDETNLNGIDYDLDLNHVPYEL